MACEQFNRDWIAYLYGELDSESQRRLDDHRASCAECRTKLDELAASSRLLREAAPAVPPAPRVVVLRPGATRQPLWAFAAGAACALGLIAAGVFTGVQMGQGSDPESVERIDQSPELARTEPGLSRAEFDQAMQAQQRMFETRLAEVEAHYANTASADSAPPTLTRDELEVELTRLQRLFEVKHAAEFEFLSEEIAATEARTATWIGENREALNYLALRTDPRVSEQ
jgi:hypothetical protein